MFFNLVFVFCVSYLGYTFIETIFRIDNMEAKLDKIKRKNK